MWPLVLWDWLRKGGLAWWGLPQLGHVLGVQRGAEDAAFLPENGGEGFLDGAKPPPPAVPACDLSPSSSSIPCSAWRCLAQPGPFLVAGFLRCQHFPTTRIPLGECPAAMPLPLALARVLTGGLGWAGRWSGLSGSFALLVQALALHGGVGGGSSGRLGL